MNSHTRVTVQPVSEPVTVADLKNRIGHNNGTTDDTYLSHCIKTARQTFERYTGLAIMPQTLRQYVDRWHHKTVPIFVGPVATITSVVYYDASDAPVTLSDYTFNPIPVPATIRVETLPVLSKTARPVLYIEYTAGSSTVDSSVWTALCLLAQFYYETRTAYTNDRFHTEVPQGFRAICDQYRTGLGNWRH